mgnify:CR=1 FL=1
MTEKKDKKSGSGQTARRRLTGVIVSDKMQKTAVVEIMHLRKHSRYLKYYPVTRRVKAHNEGGFKAGDRVSLEETRPLSREKRWRIVGLAKGQPVPPSSPVSPL